MANERHGTPVVLPSRGLPYQGQLVGGEIIIYSMTTAEEKLFAGVNRKIDFENVIDTLIRRCSNLPLDLKPGDLYIGDRTFLLMNIRAASYGANYGFAATCTECRARWDHEIDITKDLDVQDVTDDHEDPFKIELPNSGDEVTLRLFRGFDERSIIKFVDNQTKKVNLKQIGDPGYTYRLALHVVGVDSATNPTESFSADACVGKPGSLIALATDYIEKLSAMDSSAVREEIDSRTPGIILRMDIDCPKCSNRFDLSLPLTTDFFRAKSSAGLRTKTRAVPR